MSLQLSFSNNWCHETYLNICGKWFISVILRRKWILTVQKNVRDLIDHLWNVHYENYTPEQNLSLNEYLSLWKGHLAFKIYIPSKRERYGIKLCMVSESDTGYLRRFIIYTGTSIVYQEPTKELSKPFDNYLNPSKVVLSLL